MASELRVDLRALGIWCFVFLFFCVLLYEAASFVFDAKIENFYK